MNNAPTHAAEHEQLMQLLAKVSDKSALIGGIVLITIGRDGRPCIGSNIGNPATISRVLRELGGAEEHIVNVSEVDVPEDN